MQANPSITHDYSALPDVAPGVFTAPIRGELAFNAMPGPVYEYACHEGNYSFPNQLLGHRLAEQTREADK